MTAGINNRALGIGNHAFVVGPDDALAPLLITNLSLPDMVIGQAYSTTMQQTGAGGRGRASTPVWSAVGLPAGVTIDDATGIISVDSVTATAGNYPVLITVADGVHVPTTVGYMLVVTAVTGVAITTSSMPAGQIGAPYSAPMSASGGHAPYTWSATVGGVAMPAAGLDIDATTGTISGTPTGSAGTKTIVVTATDSDGVAAPRTYAPNFSAGSITITTTSDFDPAVNGDSDWSYVINAVGGTGTRVWSILSGAPSGMTIGNFFNAGVVVGPIHDTAGTYTIQVQVVDAAGQSDIHTYTLVLTDPPVAPGALPWTRRLAIGNLGVPNNYFDEIATAIAAGTNRLSGGYGRLGFNWWAMDPDGNGVLTTGSGTNFNNQKGKFDHAATKGVQGLPIAAYSAVSQQRILTFEGSTGAGNVVTWTGGVGSGLDAQMKAAGGGKYLGGHYAGGTLSGPGVSGAQRINSQSSSGLTLAGGVTAGKSGTYQLGGHGVADNDKAFQTVLPSGSGPATFGKYTGALVAALGALIKAIELGNETNQTLGSFPFVDPVLQYKLWCHAWVAAHLANPSIIVISAGTASTRSGGPSGRLQTTDFYDAMLDCARAVDTHHIIGAGVIDPNYFRDLCAANGLTKDDCPDVPYDGIGMHVYGGDPGIAPNTNMNEAAYVWNQHRIRGGGGAPLPLFFTEQGPGWGAAGFLSARQSFLWFKNFIDLLWGNIRWPHDALGGLESTTLSLAERRALAATIFGPALSQCLLELDGFGDHVGLYTSDGTPKFDSYALNAASTTVAAASNNKALPEATITVASTAGFKPSGWLLIGPASGASRQMHVQYTGMTGTTFTGCTGGSGTLATGMKVTPANSLLDALIHADAA